VRTKGFEPRPAMIAVNDLAFVLRTATEFGVVEMLCLVGVLSAVRMDLLGGRHHVARSGLVDGVRDGVAVHTEGVPTNRGWWFRDVWLTAAGALW
jgi:hypothetical protein